MNIELNAQKKRLKEVINSAGPRYTPKLNVKVSIANIFEGAGRTSLFFEEMKSLFREVSDASRNHNEKEFSKTFPKFAEKIKAEFKLLTQEFSKIPDGGCRKNIDFHKIVVLAKEIDKMVDVAISEISTLKQVEPENPEEKNNWDNEKFREETNYLYNFSRRLNDLVYFSQGKMAKASNEPLLLLSGIAGSGKTHLLCDIAQARLNEGLPTYIFLGEEFMTENPWELILNKFQCNNVDIFLKALDHYAKSRNTRALIIVDALNEQQAKKIYWNKLLLVKQYKSIGLIFSIRRKPYLEESFY